jgi:hypothetical protein
MTDVAQSKGQMKYTLEDWISMENRSQKWHILEVRCRVDQYGGHVRQSMEERSGTV